MMASAQHHTEASSTSVGGALAVVSTDGTPTIAMSNRNNEEYALDVEYQELHEIDAELMKLTEMTEDTKTHETCGVRGGSSINGRRASSTTLSDSNRTRDKEMEGDDESEVDKRSIYVGNVDYHATPQELQEHFKTCGSISRITIMVDKFTGCPKGYAYVEFSNPDAVTNAVVLSNTIFKGRQIKVDPKRKNIFGFNRRRGGRGATSGAFRGGRGGPPSWGMYYGRGMPMYGGRGMEMMGSYYAPHNYGPSFRGRGRGTRGPY